MGYRAFSMTMMQGKGGWELFGTGSGKVAGLCEIAAEKYLENIDEMISE
jgi:hypothetical protein